MFAGLLRQRKESQSLVEFGLILPSLIFILVGAVDLGRVYYDSVAINGAAEAGSLVAIEWRLVRNPPSPAEANAAVREAIKRQTNPDVFPFFQISDADIVLDIPWVRDRPYTITVNRQFIFITPLVASIVSGGGPLNLRTTVRGRHNP